MDTKSLWTHFPEKGATIIDYTPFFAHTSPEMHSSILIELAKNYCYKSSIFSFVWGVHCEHLPGTFKSKGLQEIVDKYNALPFKSENSATGYFAFQFTDKWLAYYTPPFEEKIESIKKKIIIPFHDRPHIGLIEVVNSLPLDTPIEKALGILFALDPPDGDSVIVDDIYEEDIIKLANFFAEEGCIDINHLL
jgi:hypothetical protein